jgi:hypothetical protein
VAAFFYVGDKILTLNVPCMVVVVTDVVAAAAVLLVVV